MGKVLKFGLVNFRKLPLNILERISPAIFFPRIFWPCSSRDSGPPKKNSTPKLHAPESSAFLSNFIFSSPNFFHEPDFLLTGGDEQTGSWQSTPIDDSDLIRKFGIHPQKLHELAQPSRILFERYARTSPKNLLLSFVWADCPVLRRRWMPKFLGKERKR